MTATEPGLPDFVIIGTQKGGTTSLWHYLRSHPDVFMPDLKETDFFIEEGRWSLGLDWYRSLFAGRRPGQVAGEASPGYTMFPTFAGAPGRLAAVVPGVKLIYVIREPLARMASNWTQSRVDYLESRPLGPSIISDLRYVSLSQYALQIDQYLEHFDRASLLVIRTEDLAADPESTMKTVCDFVGVDPARLGPTGGRHNVFEEKMVPLERTIAVRKALIRLGQRRLAARLTARPAGRLTHRPAARSDVEMDEDLRRRMLAYLRLDLQRLRQIVGPEMDLWGYV